MDVLEILYMKDHAYLFPLSAVQNHSLIRLDIDNRYRSSAVGTGSTKVIDALTKAFIKSKEVQVAIYYCLHHRLEASMFAGIQVQSFFLISGNSFMHIISTCQ